MKIKKLAVAIGTVMMMSVFGMGLTAQAADKTVVWDATTLNKAAITQGKGSSILTIEYEGVKLTAPDGALFRETKESKQVLHFDYPAYPTDYATYYFSSEKYYLKKIEMTGEGFDKPMSRMQDFVIENGASTAVMTADEDEHIGSDFCILKGYAEKIVFTLGELDNTPVVTSAMNVQLKKTLYTATGKSIKPSIKAVKVNGKKLAKKDYKVTYKNNKKPGKAQVVVTGKGKYKALHEIVEFTIKPAKAKVSKVKGFKNSITVTWKKQLGVAGYEVQYSTNRKFTDAKSVYTNGYKATKTTIKDLTSKTKLYVRVRSAAFVDNNEVVYGNWSSVKKVTVK